MSGVAYAIPPLEKGGPVMRVEEVNGEVQMSVVAYMTPDPGYHICRAVVKYGALLRSVSGP